jgi:hypothetical protein
MRQPYEGLVGAAEGGGPPVTLLVVADALVRVLDLATTRLVAEPCDTVPMGASETADDESIEIEEGV